MFPAEVQAMVSFMRDTSMTGQRLKRGSVRRMLSYARPYRLQVSIFLAVTVLSAGMLTAIDFGPAPARHKPSQSREPGPVGWLVPHPVGVPPQYRVLIPEHQLSP
jgi:hypothetical protein